MTERYVISIGTVNHIMSEAEYSRVISLGLKHRLEGKLQPIMSHKFNEYHKKEILKVVEKNIEGLEYQPKHQLIKNIKEVIRELK